MKKIKRSIPDYRLKAHLRGGIGYVYSYCSLNKSDFERFCQLAPAFKCTYHHRSIARDYRPSGSYCLEKYSGKFGVGFILRLPSNVSFCNSNSYHEIQYYLYEQD